MLLAVLLPVWLLAFAPVALAVGEMSVTAGMSPNPITTSDPYVFVSGNAITFTVTNSSIDDYESISAAAAGSNFTVSTIPVATVTAGGTTTFTITPNGATVGQSDTITVTANLGGNTYTHTFGVRMAYEGNAITEFKVGTAEGTIDSVAHTVVLELPFGTDLTSVTPTITLSTGAASTPETNKGQNFAAAPSNTISYSVVSEKGDIQAWSVKVTAAAGSSAKNITNFAVNGSMGNAVITDTSDTAGTITVTMPAGVALSTLAPTFTIPDTASVSPVSGTARDFSTSSATPLEYTVTAQDNSTKVYKVTITNAAGSSAKDITGFTVPNMVGSAVINSTTAPYTVTAVVKYGTGLTSLTPTITTSQYATISPASLAAQNFTNPIPYTVTAQDGSTKAYTVTITAQDANNAKSLDSFSINGYTGSIVGTTVTVDMPYGTNVNSLIPTYSYTGKAISLTSGQAMSFVNPVTVRVTANDNTYIDYTVTVNVMAASSEKQITNFTIPNMVGNAVINHTARTITVTMPAGTSVTALTPTITTTFGATVTPASLVAQNFTSPVTYTVRATDGSTTTYTVTVVLEGNITLTHTGTGVRASGNINSNATLNVTENSLHASGTCTACGHIRDWMAQGSVLKVYNVEISSGYTGNVTITMPVSTSYSGRQLTVVHCNNGTLERTNATVDTSGNISASFSSVSPFAVLNGLYSGLPGDGADPPKTGDDMTYFSWGALLVTMALLLAAVFGMYLINRRRKQLG